MFIEGVGTLTGKSMNEEKAYSTSFQSNRIKFGLLLTVQLLTLPCFVYVAYQYRRRSVLRKKLHYGVIFVLLVVSFLFITISLTLTEIYMYHSFVHPPFDAFCSLWNWFHYSVNIINLFLMGFASIERNILIFHAKLLQTRRQKFLFHTCPILFCLVYPPMFYIGAIFICPCTNQYDFTQLLCTWPCYFGHKLLANVDLFFNNYVPLLTIPIFCNLLYIRVFFQRRAMRQQALKWRRDRRLILQLWVISSLYLSMWMPIQVVGVVNIYLDPAFLVRLKSTTCTCYPT